MRINSVATWLGFALSGSLSNTALAHHETGAMLANPVLGEHTNAGYIVLALVAAGLICSAGRWIFARTSGRDDG